MVSLVLVWRCRSDKKQVRTDGGMIATKFFYTKVQNFDSKSMLKDHKPQPTKLE
jgi:hypothetical protein